MRENLCCRLMPDGGFWAWSPADSWAGYANPSSDLAALAKKRPMSAAKEMYGNRAHIPDRVGHEFYERCMAEMQERGKRKWNAEHTVKKPKKGG